MSEGSWLPLSKRRRLGILRVNKVSPSLADGEKSRGCRPSRAFGDGQPRPTPPPLVLSWAPRASHGEGARAAPASAEPTSAPRQTGSRPRPCLPRDSASPGETAASAQEHGPSPDGTRGQLGSGPTQDQRRLREHERCRPAPPRCCLCREGNPRRGGTAQMPPPCRRARTERSGGGFVSFWPRVHGRLQEGTPQRPCPGGKQRLRPTHPPGPGCLQRTAG